MQPFKIEDLRFRFEEIAALVALSWKENREESFDYNPEFLGSFFRYPGIEPHFSPAVYDDCRLVAFVAGSPRQAVLHGRPLRLMLLTLFSVAPEFKGRGLGKAVLSEAAQRAQQLGFDGIIHYCVEGNISNFVTVRAIEAVGFRCLHVFTVGYLVRLLNPAMAGGSGPRNSASPEEFLEASQGVRQEVNLRRVWSYSEAQWHCIDRSSPVSACVRGKSGAGVIAGYELSNSDQARTRIAVIDDILWDRLAEAEQAELLQQFLREAAGSAQMAIVPRLNYTDERALERNGFRKSRRRLNMYLTLWDGSAPESLESFYMDVL